MVLLELIGCNYKMLSKEMMIKSVIGIMTTKVRVLAYTGVIRQCNIIIIVGKYSRSMSDDGLVIH